MTARPASFDAEVLAARQVLMGTAMKLTSSKVAAEDLVQDTIERALANFTLFHGGNLRGWLVVVMRNLYFAQHKRARRWVEDPNGAAAASLIQPQEQEAVVYLDDVVRRIEHLPFLQREALLLAVDGVSYDEIADRAGVPVGTIKSRLARAREALDPGSRRT
ncbi:hypothetical protein AA309_20110 [Microvirga vignae]|uniref:RNA polymerase sigma factor n=1 Tax=Microvirga vignae TaxID=1225564 RepID=A0A0H1RFN4_9HYPH|nr:sigma-70 family RNA polymerase sigma factor [Microvirga vignae]KLK91407.1 hypothetical protein AA309_20110 [Microvirga vignae]